MKKRLLNFCKRSLAVALAFAMTAASLPALGVDAAETALAEETLIKAGSFGVSEENVTYDQPFAPGTGESEQFRIPCLIELKGEHEGRLLAVADARWTTSRDCQGLDTIASISDDGGKTWYYSFPIRFQDNGTVAAATGTSTTAIDPVVVQGTDGTIYCVVDMNPSGVTTQDIWPGQGTGYEEINGKDRLVLTDTWVRPTSKNWSTYGDTSDAETYAYYVGDYTDGYAPVLNRADHTATKWVVDEWFNIYEISGDEYVALTQSQVVSNPQTIQQNLYYKDSVLHVYSTGYLWLVKSYDGGETWEAPEILNSQIKRANDSEMESALLASPGQGIVASNGDIIIPFYNSGFSQEHASFIWSEDNGKTWTRSNDVGGQASSENEIVELHNGVLRMFFRNTTGTMCYADIEKVDGTWVIGNGQSTGISVKADCNITAIRYSEEINGKMALVVGCPSAGSGWTRLNGRLHTFLVDENNEMELYSTYDVNDGPFQYCCATELSNGNIGLLWEPAAAGEAKIRYDEIDIDLVLGRIKNIELEAGQSYVEETSGDAALEITKEPDAAVAAVTSEHVVEEAVVTLHKHTANSASSVEGSFDASADETVSLEDAVFTFTKSGENWKIYSEKAGTYLTNAQTANAFFSASASDMKVEKVENGYRICKADGTRYIIFFNTNMDFNSNTNYSATFTNGTYDLTILEKQDSVSEDDVVPGFKYAEELTDGGKYVIGHVWEDGSVIVLYPENGTANQTKLVGDVMTLAKNVVTITGVAKGTTKAVVGDVEYNITVKAASIPTSVMTATAGDYEPNGGASEGPANLAIDGNSSTMWHTDWDLGPNHDNHWLQLELNEIYAVDGFRYQPRQSGQNGLITGYEISVSVDGEEWTLVAEGTWAGDSTWKEVTFEAVNAKYVKLQVTDAMSDQSVKFASAAEVRLTGTKGAIEVEPEPDVDYRDLLRAGSISAEEGNVTADQPFAAGTADVQRFRIPALITLDNGDILAAADARWTQGGDFCGLDTIASVSGDNGKTWNYSFPIYFPDSSIQSPPMEVATTAIDPVLVQGNDGTIYCIADMNPSGITTGDIMPSTGTGYAEVDGQLRLMLTGTYKKPVEGNQASYGNPAEYEYYVGDFVSGFAPVLNTADGSATEWAVDEWYNIYSVEDGKYVADLTQTQVNSDTVIQQNVFYKDSCLHVFSTGYLWLVKSYDNGRTWEDPEILNTQIKREGEIALLASPGQGIVASNGDIIIPFYDHGDGYENASFIWSDDNGKTWTRTNDVTGMWSSESEIVELYDGVLRMFYRNGQGAICYADATKEGDTWTMGAGKSTGIPVCSTCNVSAIRYSEEVDGKMAVIVACPSASGSRANGKLFTFLVEEDNTMKLYSEYAVNEGYYAYSCVTELENGNLGLLWENQGSAIRYDEIEIDAALGKLKNIKLEAGQTYVEETAGSAALEITQKPDEKIATVTSEYIVEDAAITLHSHVANVDSSVSGSFSETADSAASLEDAVFTFTKSGENWQIYNETKGVYLTNANVAGEFFSSAAGDMKVEKVENVYRICKASGTRYVIFFYTNMDFNSNSAYSESFGAGSYELAIFEKQAEVSNDDVVPGFKYAEELKDGGEYLIGYVWDDGSVIVLYPTNGTAAQTKLVGNAASLAKNVVTITGVSAGTTTAVVGGVEYNIVVKTASIPTSEMTATAGDAQSGEGAEMVLDGNSGTTWHTDWYEGPSHDNHWIQLELNDIYEIDGFRYQPRQSGTNGIITKYEIYVSLDGESWTKVSEGNWAGDSSWKEVEFDAVYAKYVKLQTVEAMSDQSVKFASAAEIRLTGKKAEGEIEIPVNKDALADLLTEVGGLHAEDYTEESVNALLDVWYAAAEVYADEDATQKEVDDALAALEAAVEALEPAETPGPSVDVDALTEKIDEAQAVLDSGDLTEEEAAKLKEAIDAAVEAAEVAESQEAVDKALADLEAVIEEVTAEDEFVNPFVDVTEADYFYNAVAWAVKNDVTAGITPTTFEPYTECNRAQIVLFLYRALDGEASDAENPFTDVSEADYCYDAVLWAVENGITTGITATTFEPWKECSRAEIVTFLWRAMGSEKVETATTFPDVNEADFFYDAVAWAVENGVTQGRNDGTFGAWLGCWRCDAVTFIQRAVEK